jgi:hypothetical protein
LTVNYIASATAAVKSTRDFDTRERELFVNALRVGSAKAKLIASELDSIQAAIRQRAITVDDALEWAERSEVSEWIEFGPGVRHAKH